MLGVVTRAAWSLGLGLRKVIRIELNRIVVVQPSSCGMEE